MHGTKVAGHSSLIRRTGMRGVIVSTDREASEAAFRGRQTRERQEEELDYLRKKVELLMGHLGITDDGGQS